MRDNKQKRSTFVSCFWHKRVHKGARKEAESINVLTAHRVNKNTQEMKSKINAAHKERMKDKKRNRLRVQTYRVRARVEKSV